jgi:hypothetical protein
MTLCIKGGAVDTLLTVLQQGCSDCTSASATHGPLALTYAAQCILKMAPVEECKAQLIAQGGTLPLSPHAYGTGRIFPRPRVADRPEQSLTCQLCPPTSCSISTAPRRTALAAHTTATRPPREADCLERRAGPSPRLARSRARRMERSERASRR